MKEIVKCGLFGGATAAIIVAAGLAYAWSGTYDVGADEPHWPVTYDFLQWARGQSIQAHAAGIEVPNLDDPELILSGAGDYAAMCTGCHLRPGQRSSELRMAMYPQPPDLTQVHVEPEEAFWVIKHGIKMSGMPAWGKVPGHDDETIWGMVAFIGKLPGMTAAEYRAIVAKAPPDEHESMDGQDDHAHHSPEAHAEAPPPMADMPSMPATPPHDAEPATHSHADEH
ncbi:MAG: cytochrome c [Nevskiaceae bacterium]|nr:MAG: cytochrome c [Nevskiaceae bacterium]TBR71847.1 MAG: cytochrome c [Nevskiaceae bacterium]